MKKIISAFLCLMMLISAMSVSAFALKGSSATPNSEYGEKYVLGDANCDGKVDVLDAIAIKKDNAKVGDAEIDPAADIINDGKITAKDLLALKKSLAGGEENALAQYETDKDIGYLSIGGISIKEFCIVYAEDAKYVENMYFAADTLRRFINMSTGVNLKIDTAATAEHKIEFVDVTTIEGLEEELEIENYKWEVKDGNLYIYGTRRGNMYAVYEIIEDYLGYRFFHDDFTYQYVKRFVDIEEGTSVVRKPWLDFRIVKQGFIKNDQVHYFPRRLNGSQHGSSEWYMGTLTGPHFINAHSYGYYWRMATGQVDVDYENGGSNVYAAKYEVGVVQNELEWNPCFTDDEVYETLFRGLLETMRYIQGWHTFRPETSSMSFSICDNRKVCSCNNCQYIMKDGYSGRDEDKIERLNAGEAGLNLYMANRAARDIREYYEGRPASTDAEGWDSMDERAGYGGPIYDEYPDMKIYTIFYDHSAPNDKLLTDERYADLVPEDNLILMWCGTPCNNHGFGTGKCNGAENVLYVSADESADAMRKWGDIFQQCNAELWFWVYPVNYNTLLVDSPNLFATYEDVKFVVEECHATGIYYEGVMSSVENGYNDYGFEQTKSHAAAALFWSMEEDENGNLKMMSFEEYCDAVKEHMMVYYGPGYELIYELAVMYETAGDESGICFVNNVDYPGDMFDYEYFRDNYEYMRQLILDAIEMTSNEDQRERIEWLLVGCDVLGLTAKHKDWYVNGTEETKKLYVDRFTEMYNYVMDNNMRISLHEDYNPDEHPFDPTTTPLKLFYGGGTWRIELGDQWGKLSGYPVFM